MTHSRINNTGESTNFVIAFKYFKFLDDFIVINNNIMC